MKGKRKGINLVLTTMLMLGILGSAALAQEGSIKSVALSMMLPGGGTIICVEARYEIVLNPSLTLDADGRLGLATGGIDIFGGQLGIRKYLTPTAPEGLWIGGFGSVDFWTLTIIPEWLEWSGMIFGLGAEGGYKYFFTPELSVEPFVRVGLYTAGLGLALTVGASLGYVF